MKMKVAILGLVLLLLSGGVTVVRESGMKGAARRVQTREAMRKVASATEMYRSDYGAWPPDADGRAGMIIDDKLLLWIGPYMRKSPDDGWGVPLRYTLSESQPNPPEIRSAGPDMKFETRDDLTNR